MNRKLLVVIVCMGLIVASGSAFAGRPDKAFKSWFGHLGVGYSLPQSTFGDFFDDDWHFNGGATYWPEEWVIGIELDLAYSSYDVKSSVVRTINDEIADSDLCDDSTPNCSLSGIDYENWDLGINGVWGPKSSGSVGFYLKAGVSANFQEARAKTTGLVYYPGFCDPWYPWWCYPGGVGQGTLIVAKESSTDFGWNTGVGLTFNLNSGSQIFVEATYRATKIGGKDVTYVPVIVGYKW